MNSTKKVLIYAFVVLLVILLGVYLWNYLRYGTINVVSEEGTVISISKVKDSEDQDSSVLFESDSGKLSARLSPGDYIVSIRGKVEAINKTVTTKARETTNLTLKPPKIIPTEPVTSVEANNINATNSSLVFTDSSSGFLSEISRFNDLGVFGGTLILDRIEWSDANNGIGEDDRGNLYMINGARLTKINLPGSQTTTSHKSFSISQDLSAYVSSGPDIYSVKSSNTPRKIFTTKSATPLLTSSNGKIAIINPPPNDSFSADQQSDNQPYVELINDSGTALTKKPLLATSGSWSPNGKMLLLSNYYGKTAIYDNKLNIIKTIPNNGISKFSWINNEDIIFSTDNVVWNYSIPEESSWIYTQLEPGNTISSLSADEKSGFVYLSTSPELEGGISRFNINNLDIPKGLQTLDIFLPVVLDDCRIDYINFVGRPTIIMETTLSKKSICKAQTDIELSQDGLDPNNFSYQFDLAGGSF